MLVVLVGAARAEMQDVTVPDLGSHGDAAARVIGRLVKHPEWRGIGAYLDLALESVDAQPWRGRARLTEFLDDPEQRTLFDALDLGSGDRVEVVVKLHRPGVYRDPGVFDYRHYLERLGLYWTGTIRNPRLITILGRGWHGQDRVKKWMQARIEKPFATHNEIQGLVLAMVLGRKFGLTGNVERLFQDGGLYHLLVVSGFNLAVVAGAAAWLASFAPCKRHTRLLFVAASALGYAALVEGQAPVDRAALAVLLLIAGKLLDRPYAALNAAAVSAFILLLIDPASIEDSSFQMTFAAVLAVIGVGVPANQWAFSWLRDGLKDFDDATKDADLPIAASDWRVAQRGWCERHRLPPWTIAILWKIVLYCGQALAMSLCVEIIFVYFMVESFHRLSPAAILLNLPAGMIAATVTPLALLLIFLPAPAATVVAWFVSNLIALLLGTLGLVLQLPGATIRVPSPPVWVWVVYALVVAIGVVAVHKRDVIIVLSTFLAALALQTAITLVDFSPAPPKDVTLTFLDVGQGDSLLIEFPSGYRMLIDGGGVSSGRFLDLRDESTFSIGENVLSPYLFSRGTRRLDAVVLTHAHHDHMDGLFSVIENFNVGEIWLGRNPLTPRYSDLLDRIHEKRIPIRWVAAGQVIGPFTVIHPPATWIPRRNDQNNDSVVLLLNTGNATALLTGDIESRISVPETVDVLKVPHHGSRGVRIHPKASVRIISVGANNPFGHPHQSALPALRTDQLGAIVVSLSSAWPTGKTPRTVSINISTPALTETRCSCKLAFLFRRHYSQRL
jgi:competence protein ComEC